MTTGNGNRHSKDPPEIANNTAVSESAVIYPKIQVQSEFGKLTSDNFRPGLLVSRGVSRGLQIGAITGTDQHLPASARPSTIKTRECMLCLF
jgi:hypothetical protein